MAGERTRSGAAGGWWPTDPHLRGDLEAVVLVAGLVALVVPDRADWASHVLAGGGVVMAGVALAVHRLGRAVVPLGGLVVLAVATVLDLTLTGPFDPSDVAFTLAGALLVTAPPPGAPVDRRTRLIWGAVLIALALANRYGVPRAR